MFIVFEGIDGSGKTTLARRLLERLQALKLPAIYTREPGGTKLGTALRSMLLDQPLDPITTLLLMSADRAHHVNTLINPALDSGKIVICDRYTDSTRVYQGYVAGFDRRTIESQIKLASQGVRPDLIFWIKIQPEAAHRRLVARGGNNHFDRLDTLIEADLGYQRLYLQDWRTEDPTVRFISGEGNPEDIEASIWDALKNDPIFMERHGQF